MTVREYLSRPEEIRREIARKQSRAETLRCLAQRLTAPPREVCIRTSADPARMQAFLAEVADGEQEIRLLEEELEQALADAALYVSRLPEEKLIRLLELRYLEGCGWEETAARMGYSLSSVFRLHQQALALLPAPPEDPDDVFA